MLLQDKTMRAKNDGQNALALAGLFRYALEYLLVYIVGICHGGYPKICARQWSRVFGFVYALLIHGELGKDQRCIVFEMKSVLKRF